jgi:hypothetical protein
MKVKKVGDYIIIEKPISTSDMIERLLQKAQRNRRRGRPPKPRKVGKRRNEVDRSQECKKMKAERKRRAREGLCTSCGKVTIEGHRWCDVCRARQRIRNERFASRRTILADYGDY